VDNKLKEKGGGGNKEKGSLRKGKWEKTYREGEDGGVADHGEKVFQGR